MDKIRTWLDTTPYKYFTISIASSDASFRRYFRLENANEKILLMDSSLELDSLVSFLKVTNKLKEAGVQVPKILNINLNDGFLIIEDFGNKLLLDVLDNDNYKSLYINAIEQIIRMQSASTKSLPLYDKKFLLFEMNLMSEWYLQKKLNLTLNQKNMKMIESTLNSIAKVVLSQPQNVFTHRDFHSRNIMMTHNEEMGIIDYQDAMNGPITYDLVSLLKDCYIEYEPNEIRELALAFRNQKGLHASDEEFIKWFDFMGLQRHIKILGVFSRLHLRDGKDGYLKDLPLALKYVLRVAGEYNETKEFALFLQESTS